MGCGASEIIAPIEDLKEGECLETMKDLKMYDSPKAEKMIADIPCGKTIKVLSTEVTEGPGFGGFIRAESLGCQGYIAIWAFEPKQPPGGGAPLKGPKAGHVKRINADGTPIAPKSTGPALHDWKEDRAAGA